ncbi:hypothetical protein [Aromatoleum anaerobium]|uniref:Uncharacterized protein n=1 Tax=Aromatoleum anaerobium TaxID=182180 RepID=A0ABX1PR02_9RHOO
MRHRFERLPARLRLLGGAALGAFLRHREAWAARIIGRYPGIHNCPIHGGERRQLGTFRLNRLRAILNQLALFRRGAALLETVLLQHGFIARQRIARIGVGQHRFQQLAPVLLRGILGPGQHLTRQRADFARLAVQRVRIERRRLAGGGKVRTLRTERHDIGAGLRRLFRLRIRPRPVRAAVEALPERVQRLGGLLARQRVHLRIARDGRSAQHFIDGFRAVTVGLAHRAHGRRGDARENVRKRVGLNL